MTTVVDEKRAKVVKSNFSREVYIEECQSQIYTSMSMQRHFAAKGSAVRGLNSITCGYDDRFSRKQCRPEQCRCSDPYGNMIGSYGVERSKGEQMDCRCALEEYFVSTEKLAFDKLSCDGMGNYSPLQCVGSRMCYCADANGAPISKEFSFECVNRFVKKYAPGYDLGLICNAMRGTVTIGEVGSERVFTEDLEIYYDNTMKWYRTSKTVPLANNIESPC